MFGPRQTPLLLPYRRVQGFMNAFPGTKLQIIRGGFFNQMGSGLFSQIALELSNRRLPGQNADEHSFDQTHQQEGQGQF